jgi:hypothetical protein
MLAREKVDGLILETFKRTEGIADARALADEDRLKVIDFEQEAESRSLLGLGKVVNAGVLEVLECDWVYVALTQVCFPWPSGPSLLLKKGDEIVGEEVTDEQTMARLSSDKNVWFMHKNFVVYKDKVSFPQDIMKKICYFEIPGHRVHWLDNEHGLQFQFTAYCSPSPPCDVFLKERYFQGKDVQGTGTILIGIKL